MVKGDQKVPPIIRVLRPSRSWRQPRIRIPEHTVVARPDGLGSPCYEENGILSRIGGRTPTHSKGTTLHFRCKGFGRLVERTQRTGDRGAGAATGDRLSGQKHTPNLPHNCPKKSPK